MKALHFLVGVFILLSGIASVLAANDHLFSSVYLEMDASLDEETARRVGGMVGAEPAEILDFVIQGTMKTPTYDLSEVCTYAEEERDASGALAGIMRQQESDCIEELKKLWKREREITKTELILIHQTDAMARWWDGRLKEKGDFDLLTDGNLLDTQFYGKQALQIEAPKPDEQVQQKYSLAESEYRLPSWSTESASAASVHSIPMNMPSWSTESGSAAPADKLPFDSKGGCEPGSVSLYGGIICLPRFCTDYLCVNIKPIPGRRAAPISTGSVEASVSNLITDLQAIAARLNDAKQITPTRNPNSAHWWAQTFNWDQFWSTNFRVWPRTPPLLDELLPPGGNEKVKKTMDYKYDARTGYHFSPNMQANKPQENAVNRPNAEDTGAPAGDSEEIAATKIGIWKELENVRIELKVCREDPACDSKQLLDSFIEDCELLGNRTTSGDLAATLDACVNDFKKRADNNPLQSWDSFYAKKIESKKYIDEKMSADLVAIRKTIESFLGTITGINLCALQQAQYSCGSQKLSCVEQ